MISITAYIIYLQMVYICVRLEKEKYFKIKKFIINNIKQNIFIQFPNKFMQKYY